VLNPTFANPPPPHPPIHSPISPTPPTHPPPHPLTDPAIDNEGTLDFWYSHAMVSAEATRGIKATCDFRTIGPLLRGREALTLPDAVSTTPSRGGAAAAAAAASPPDEEGQHKVSSKDKKYCEDYLQDAMDQIGGINIYEIYADVCLRPAPSVAAPQHPLGRSGGVGAAGGEGAQQPMQCKYHGALLGSTCVPVGASTGSHQQQQQQQQQQRQGALGVVLSWLRRVQQWLGAGAPSNRSSSSSSSSRGSSGVSLPGRIPRYNPCVDGAVETYLNLPEVGRLVGPGGKGGQCCGVQGVERARECGQCFLQILLCVLKSIRTHPMASSCSVPILLVFCIHHHHHC
jgi:hypothetical protein